MSEGFLPLPLARLEEMSGLRRTIFGLKQVFPMKSFFCLTIRPLYVYFGVCTYAYFHTFREEVGFFSIQGKFSSNEEAEIYLPEE